MHFRQRVSDWGAEEAKRSILLERYTVDEILKLVCEHGLEDDVDLVVGGHVSVLFTEEELNAAKQDFKAAQEVGLNVAGIEWLEAAEMLLVSRYFSHQSLIN